MGTVKDMDGVGLWDGGVIIVLDRGGWFEIVWDILGWFSISGDDSG